ncbi:MAG: hypothetical protein ACRD3J_11320 [Thermoanaerobaculia bacterium]
MRFLNPQHHRVLDFVTVAAFGLAPTFLPLDGLAAIVAYALAAVHLVVTLTTQFSATGRRPLSLRYHGMIEATVGVVLLALPFVAGWTGRARLFYLVAGAVILVVSAVSKYRVDHQAS